MNDEIPGQCGVYLDTVVWVCFLSSAGVTLSYLCVCA